MFLSHYWLYLCIVEERIDCQRQGNGGVKVIKTVAPISADVAKDIAFQLKGEVTGSLLVVISSVEGGSQC